ncbi:hypothetical protein FQN52_008020 [Onygenales sp. PD_12]|nr:hypothetical protein FQN52_008020 [Onygenales sp. PD_12]
MTPTQAIGLKDSMEIPPSTQPSLARLEQLAPNAVAALNKPCPRLRREPVSYSSPGDTEIAEGLLKQKRQQAFASKSHIFRRQPSKSGFKNDEIIAVIEQIVRANGSRGVLESLLDKSNDAKTEKRLFKHQVHQVTNANINPLLKHATEMREPAMVQLLSLHADDIGLNGSLAIAVSGRDLECSKALLQNGADPNVCHQAFLAAVGYGDLQMIELLLSAEKRMTASCLDQALPVAVSRGALDVVSLLLKNGANGDYPEVLEGAIRAGRVDVVAALVLAERSPETSSLDHAVDAAFHITESSSNARRALIEVLLCGGAKGDTVSRTLVEAVKRNDEYIVSLLITHGASVTYNSAEAIVCAIGAGNMKLLSILFKGHIDGETSSHILATLPEFTSNLSASKQLSIISSLVERGAYGYALHPCLLDAVQRNNQEIVEYLINKQASVNHDNAQVLRCAISSVSLPLFHILLKGRPSKETLELCFPLLDAVPLKPRLQMTTALLAAGAKGEEVGGALIRTVMSDFTKEKEPLIYEFVRNGIDVNVDGGKCFQLAASAGDVGVLKILLQGVPSPSSLAKGILPALDLPNSDLRFAVLDLLVSAGARGQLVDEGLVHVIDDKPVDIPLLKLLLDKGIADVNSNNGKPIEQATKQGNSELLRVLLSYNPSQSTLNLAFPIALNLQDCSIQHEICHRLLAAGVKGDPLDAGLIAAQRLAWSRDSLVELLLRYGANVNFKDGAVIRRAIKKSNEGQLKLLVSQAPSTEILAAALEMVLRTDTTAKLQMATTLLDASRGRIPEAINRLLAEAVKLKSDPSFVKLVLGYDASVNYQHGQAIRLSIETQSFDVLGLLLSQEVAKDTLEGAFLSAWKLKGSERHRYTTKILDAGYSDAHIHSALVEAVQECPCDTEIIRLLLRHGASVHHSNNYSLSHAATSMDHETLKLLLEAVSEREAVTQVFAHAISPGKAWLSAPGLQVATQLLENGASGEAVSAALCVAIENFGVVSEATEFVDLFARSGANPDYQDGRALKLAVAKGSPVLVRRLLESIDSTRNLPAAFSTILSSDLPEDITLELIEVFTQFPGGIPDLNSYMYDADGEQQEPVTFAALRRWPRGTKILETLLRADMLVDQTVPYVIDDKEGFEQVSLLLWALLQPQQKISPYVIDCLLQNGANVNFQSTGSSHTPLLVATKERTPDMVLKLIQAGADVSICDKYERTPLLFASQRGQVTTVQHLLNAGATLDDGSIHEAARELYPGIVKMLIDYGHDPNFPSIAHDGRSALAELCFYASGTATALGKMRQTIDALVAGKASLTSQSSGKPLLLHALDNPTSSPTITKAILASGLWRHINDERNIYIQDGFAFSPTMYITKSLQSSPKDQASELLHILKSNGCRDVFYKIDPTTGPQPPDMVNAPAEILEEDRRLKARARRLQEQEEEHHLALQRDLAAAEQQQLLMKGTHTLRLQQDREVAENRDACTTNSARLQLRLDADAATQRQRFAEQQRTADLQQARALNQLRLEATQEEGRLQIGYQKEAAAVQQGVFDARVNAESRRLRELEAANEKQYKRDTDLLGRQEKMFAGRKAMMEGSGGFGGMPVQGQKRIGFGDMSPD